MNKEKINLICEILEKTIPNPKTDLIYESEYMFVVAVVLSAQSTDKQVNKITEKLFKTYKTPEDILCLGLETFQEAIKSIGLYRNKAKNILKLTEILKQKYNCKIPSNREILETLPGIGRKSANVIMNILFDQPTIAVDTHVLRLSKILDLSNSDNPKQVEIDLENIIPEKYKMHISNRLVLHGRYVCTAKKPKCYKCSLSGICNKYSTAL